MDKLKQLIARCKCGVYVTANEHRDGYETPAQWLEQHLGAPASLEISDEVQAGILASGTIINVQFYPETPVGFYRIVHYDMDKALDEALACLDAEDAHELRLGADHG
ncbi:hypothetical protein EKK58_05230 [Candidatus Dependentiae bacterium]|nr:MAG: hypothetical protein EKK58_05230 [Candidatus Dependentiae bacterium]